jgi:formiminoglutamase
MGFKWSLVSIPDHQGVLNVGGRLGAATGPRAFWDAFSRMNGRKPNEVSIQGSLVTHSTVSPLTSAVEENHARAAKEVCEAARGADRTVVVGGGHDHGYSQLLGLRQLLGPEKRIACLNIDAHLDVRKPNPKIGSGSPFFLAIENGVLDGTHLVEFGIQRHCNAPELWEYAKFANIEIVDFDACRHGNALGIFKQGLEKLARIADYIVISLDLDSAAESFAPGVSAPQAEGFSSSELIEFCEVAGANAKVISLGVFELNPLHDVGHQTARLAATCAYHFLAHASRS